MTKTEKVRRVYLDNSSATPVDPRVKDAMAPFWSRDFGNPGAIYKEGVIVKKAVENSRREIAEVLKCRPGEIIFVNGATESLNLAIRGAIGAWKKTNKNKRPEIITTTIEHGAVLNTCRVLEKEGVKIVYVKPDERGIVNAKKIAGLLNENTALVSVMYANNEIGTIEPIKEIGRAIKLYKLKKPTTHYPLFHTDAVQAANYLSLDVNSLGVNLLTINAAKIYGPKGTAILYVKDKTPIEPILYGGGQERGLRPGTENVSLIVGLGKALSIACGMREKESKRQTALRDYFIKQLLHLPAVGLNGDTLNRLPNNVNVSIGGIDNEYFVIQLDEAGIACSTRSACNTGSDMGSHVILALGKSEKEASESVRFTLGRFTTKKDIDYTLSVIKKLLLDKTNKFINP